MGIQSITEIRPKAPAMPVPVGASGVAAQEPKAPAAAAPVPKEAAPAAPPPPPPPPPRKGFAMDVEVGWHEATATKVYNFVDPDSGDTVVQIPIDNVLDMVANILRQLEADGKR